MYNKKMKQKSQKLYYPCAWISYVHDVRSGIVLYLEVFNVRASKYMHRRTAPRAQNQVRSRKREGGEYSPSWAMNVSAALMQVKALY